jgi:type II secretory ATPase GspE/PulE/Tfp pilus assembly ATPase PilB-like protein
MGTQDPELERRQRLQQLQNFVAAAATIEDMLDGAQARLADVFGCERTTIYAIDTRNRHLYSLAKTGGEFKEIRVGLDGSSIAGFTGLAKKTLNLPNVYEAAALKKIHPQLQFDDRWDKASGFTTRSVLSVPVLNEQNLLGVVQIINRTDRQPFGPRDAAAAEEVARALGLAFFNLNRIKALREARKPGRWDALVDGGVISEVELNKALTEAAQQKADPARWLIDRAGVARAEVERSLSLFYNAEIFHWNGKDVIPEELRRRVKPEYLKQNCGAPVERRGNTLVCAIDDPGDLGRVDALGAIEPGLKLEVMIGLRDEILGYIEQSYGIREDVGKILRDLTAEEISAAPSAAQGDADGEGGVGETDSSVIKLANQIIADAYKRGASDIHVEPYGKDHATVVRFRVDGDCVAYQEIPAAFRNALVARFKIMANLDISEKRKPQDGKIRLKLSRDKNLELRVATIPTSGGNEDVVMRILAASKPIPLVEMGMSERNLKAFIDTIKKPYGLVLCVGPTGSGKTTTLHSALGHINTTDMKIWTAEDPVEITQAGLRQVQVQPKIGFTFENAMRAFLRADPDVIMVGEMRDKETAETGIEASLTGHLVFSTLHTNSAPETVTRLIDMGLDPFSFADALLGVLAQRLARGLCKHCRELYPAARAEFDQIAEPFGGEAQLAQQGISFGAQFQLWRGRGCENCGGSGYKGRIGLHELLVTNDDIKRAISRRAPVEEVRNLALAGGMTTLLQDGIQKAMLGQTDLKQVLAVCSR